MRRSAQVLLFACLPVLAAASAEAAMDRLCDTRKENCRTPLLELINKEPSGGGIDVAFWFMTDDNYRYALQKAHERNVRVRILVDPRANDSKAGNEAILDKLKLAGIPMRYKMERVGFSDILHWKMMFFEKGSGKPVVEFSAANYSPDSFRPFVPYQNYIDEVAYFTDDPRLTGTFAMKFEDYWTDTTGSFEDYANVSPPYTPGRVLPRYYPVVTKDPALNFPPTQDYAGKATTHYGREPAGVNGGKIDVIMYRMSDARHADAMISAIKRGIPVRLITEQENYRDARYIWHSYNADRMWAAGVQIKDHVGAKQGITHQKSVILYGQKEVIFGSSNWSTASSNQQLEHNIFSLPCTPGQVTWCDGGGPNNNPPNWFFNFFVKQFEDKWNSVNPDGFTEFKDLVPRPGGTPVNSAPGNGATGITTTGVTLRWDGGNWNHKYDVYLGTTPTLTAANKVASDIAVGSPYTGSFETWTIPFALQAGTTYYWYVVGKTMADSPRAAAAGLKLAKPGPTWAFTTAGTASGGSTAYGGTSVALPGTIQVENFDTGASGVSYFDTTSGNSGGAYGRTTDVDISVCSDTGGGYNLGYTRPGEWLKYAVNVTTSGTYTLTVRYANQGIGARFHVEVDGEDKTGPLTLQDTGGWQNWQNIQKTGIALTAGAHVVRLVLDSAASPNGAVGNYNYLTFSTGSAASVPYGGAPAPLPGVIEAENFDGGGQSVAYNDTTPGNSGGEYRKTEDVDVSTATDTGGGFNLGYTRAGEWLKYTVNVSAAGTYTVRLRYANVGSGARLHMEVDGTDKTGPMLLQDTGGWQSWRDLIVPNISLAGGTHVVKLVFDAANVQNTAVGNINLLSFSSS